VEQLTRDEATREQVLGDLDDLREGLDEAGDTDREEVVLTVMDQLVGFCSPPLSLIRVGRSANDEDTDEVGFEDDAQ